MLSGNRAYDGTCNVGSAMMKRSDGKWKVGFERRCGDVPTHSAPGVIVKLLSSLASFRDQ